MKTPDFRQEEGQSLIQVALMLVVLIGFVGLALDGGNLYAERRRMQNAADAGALAGAWAMCKVNDPAAAKAKAAEYMQKNGDLDAAVGNVDVVGYKVTAHASKSVTPFLPFTFSGNVNVPANASAACGAANKACGLWPLGLTQTDWQYYESQNVCSSGAKIAIPVGNSPTPATQCTIAGVDKFSICDCYQCTYNSQTFILTDTTNGSVWMDLTQATDIVTGQTGGTGCGTSELVDYIAGNTTKQIVKGACIAELPGAKTAAGQMQTAFNSRIGDNIGVPIFDNQACTGPTCQGGTNRHVADFGCITVANPAYVKNYNLDRKSGAKQFHSTQNLQNLNMDLVFINMNCNTNACTTTCGSTDGSPPDSNGVNASNLVP